MIKNKQTFIDKLNAKVQFSFEENKKRPVCINCSYCELQTGKDVQIVYCHKCHAVLHSLSCKQKKVVADHVNIISGKSLPMACFKKIKGGYKNI